MIVELEEAKAYMLSNREGLFNHHKGFKDFEVSKVQRLIDWIKADSNFNKITAMKNFYLFFNEQDTRNNRNFIDVFPQLETFWNECKELNGS
jgi:exoribonuclease II